MSLMTEIMFWLVVWCLASLPIGLLTGWLLQRAHGRSSARRRRGAPAPAERKRAYQPRQTPSATLSL